MSYTGTNNKANSTNDSGASVIKVLVIMAIIAVSFVVITKVGYYLASLVGGGQAVI